MKIAILGTRGIPNEYGGFERLAEHLSVGLMQNGNTVTVYNSHKHSYQEKEWNGVEIVHCYDPEYKLGTAGQFIYDLNCIWHARKRSFDVILFLGYTSSSVWGLLFPKEAIIISNMDGLEWKRDKYSETTRRFLKYAEKLAVKFSHFYIADSIFIQSYLKKKYDIDSEHIAYGAEVMNGADEHLFSLYGISKQNYYILLARIEPENNIALILEGFHQSKTDKQFIVIGNVNTKFGNYIVGKYQQDSRIQFIGGLFDVKKTHVLKTFSCLYFHGHSVGGTNPSLLEAMASRALIAAHDNSFNRAILNEDGFYFSTVQDIKCLVENTNRCTLTETMIQNNLAKVQQHYNWPRIIEQYSSFITECYKRTGYEKLVFNQ